ncbi:uncharacterized protein LOC132163048 [Corylus avellana]|uniref:uncharacterized protein LOC132163048 n=1 Tax=Corylus avellana TaxID=13451 RepID=UPI00286C5B75|nr:uncharacterized protein LOC132163048 [Corylus avellana]
MGGMEDTKERLDRTVANGEWCSLFPNVEVFVMARRSSHHNPIIISFGPMGSSGRQRNRQFRFEARWTKLDGYEDTIKRVWRAKARDENPWTRVKSNLSSCQHSLKVWVKKQVLSNEEIIRRKTAILEELQTKPREPNHQAEEEIKAELHGLLEQEDLKWRQRAKVEWLKNGDWNTKYFHACAKQRMRRNQVTSIKDALDRVCDSPAAVGDAFVSFFKTLLTLAKLSGMEECTSAIKSKVTFHMNQNLTREFTTSEVNQALD